VKEIEAEGFKYIYCTRSDGIPLARVVGPQRQEAESLIHGLELEGIEPFMQRQLAQSSDIRLVYVQRFFQPHIADVFYLHWDDGNNLNTLDEKVERGNFTDIDFKNSLLTVYRRIECPNCHLWWDALIVKPADSYWGDSKLFDAKIALRSSSFKSCPNCGASFRRLVAKIFKIQEK